MGRSSSAGAWGSVGHGSADCAPVAPFGHPVYAVAAAELPRIRLHDLRHTSATLALAAGEHPKVVQERLGHATISQTMDTYAHVTPALHEAAADRLAALVDGEA